jgi:hypothetical protein
MSGNNRLRLARRISMPLLSMNYADGIVHRTELFTEPQVAAVNP